MTESAAGVSIAEIIEKQMVTTSFQALVSIKRRSLLGVEALARCTAPGEDIPPMEMFRMAHEQGMLLELDRLCRHKALEAFAPIHAKNKGILLSINVDGHSIDTEVARSGYLNGAVKSFGISPNNVQGVVTYSAIVEVDNPEEKLRPGMTATITIKTREAKGALRVPNAALRYRPSPPLGIDG